MIPTLFDQENQIDLTAQRKVTRYALDAGANGVVFPGVASEYNFLSLEERAELIKLVASEVNGKVPIIGGASAPDPEESIAAGKQAMDCGIRLLMIMAPAGLGSDLEKHRQFFQRITSALGKEVEIMLQNAPSPIGAGLTAKAIMELVDSNSQITYIKEETLPSGPAISTLREAESGHLKAVFGGGGARYIIDELNRGARGAMPAVELTDLHVRLFEAFEAGDHALARKLYQVSLPLLVSQAVYRMRLTKYVLARRGIVDSQGLRAPLPEIDSEASRDLDQMIADLEEALES